MNVTLPASPSLATDAEVSLLWFEELVCRFGDPSADHGINMEFEYPPPTVADGGLLPELLNVMLHVVSEPYGTGAWRIIARERELVDTWARISREMSDEQKRQGGQRGDGAAQPADDVVAGPGVDVVGDQPADVVVVVPGGQGAGDAADVGRASKVPRRRRSGAAGSPAQGSTGAA